MGNRDCYKSICPEAKESCEYAKVEEVFFFGSDGLGPCIKGGDCDEKLLRAIVKLGIKLPFNY